MNMHINKIIRQNQLVGTPSQFQSLSRGNNIKRVTNQDATIAEEEIETGTNIVIKHAASNTKQLLDE